MTKKSLFSFILIAFVFLVGNSAFAKDITLAWDPNEEPDVVGYRVYYKIDSSSLPFDGAGASEGVSPVDAGDNLSLTLTGLREDQIIYFAVTAYNSAGEESSFSNVVASDWIPEVYFPQNAEMVDPQQVEFSWSDTPADTEVSYTLYYGTDPHLNPPTLISQTFNNSTLMGAAFLGLLGAGLSTRRKRQAALVLGLAGALFLLCSCSGGGGGGNDPDQETPPPINVGGAAPGDSTGSPQDPQLPTDGGAAPTNATVEVSGITETFHTVADLQANTTYYWKIVAVDAQGKRSESETRSFTTGAY
ncbi:MAG: fibronectin type III domain-containing protein [Desulfuromonadales bacterium]|jgi:fibronectin type 3 domain-containing protein